MDVYQNDTKQSVGILTLDTELTEEHTPLLDRIVEKLVDNGANSIVINCEYLRYISSYGLSWLIKMHKRLSVLTGNSDCQVFLVGPQQYVIDTVKEAKLDRMLHIVPNMEACMSTYQ